jgi:hypothetical protein
MNKAALGLLGLAFVLGACSGQAGVTASTPTAGSSHSRAPSADLGISAARTHVLGTLASLQSQMDTAALIASGSLGLDDAQALVQTLQ